MKDNHAICGMPWVVHRSDLEGKAICPPPTWWSDLWELLADCRRLAANGPPTLQGADLRRRIDAIMPRES